MCKTKILLLNFFTGIHPTSYPGGLEPKCEKDNRAAQPTNQPSAYMRTSPLCPLPSAFGAQRDNGFHPDAELAFFPCHSKNNYNAGLPAVKLNDFD